MTKAFSWEVEKTAGHICQLHISEVKGEQCLNTVLTYEGSVHKNFYSYNLLPSLVNKWAMTGMG